jgi:hypothetical protein
MRVATLDIPISECGKLVRVKINEGGTKSLYAMKLVPPKDLGSIVYHDTWYYLLKVLALGTINWQACGHKIIISTH